MINLDSVLERYEKARKTCPKCGQKMTPLDFCDYCYNCGTQIEKLSKQKTEET